MFTTSLWQVRPRKWPVILVGLLGLLVIALQPFMAWAQPAPQVTRVPASAEISPGEIVTFTITPSDFGGFYAVKEELGNLEVVDHTADNFEDGTFIMLQAKTFSYDVKVPDDADPGQQFTITGQWWTDPTDKHSVEPGETVLSVPPGVEGTVLRTPEEKPVQPGEVVTFTLTPSDFGGFYAVKEELGDLVVVDHTADNFEDGTFIMLQAQAITYDVKVPDDAQPGEQFTITGQWWTDPNDKQTVQPLETVLTVSALCGDQNGDGAVDVLDIIIDLKISVGLIVPTPAQEILGDLNRDGTIDVSDAIIGLQYIVGLIPAVEECGPSV